jgi:hypothetical protein
MTIEQLVKDNFMNPDIVITSAPCDNPVNITDPTFDAMNNLLTRMEDKLDNISIRILQTAVSLSHINISPTQNHFELDITTSDVFICHTQPHTACDIIISSQNIRSTGIGRRFISITNKGSGILKLQICNRVNNTQAVYNKLLKSYRTYNLCAIDDGSTVFIS